MTTCLITGANRGIGLELTRHYAARGDAVIAAARDPDRATALSELGKNNPRIEIVTLDVTDEKSLARLAAQLGGRPIERLIANAGTMGPRGGYADPGHTAAAWADLLAVNVTGTFFTIRTFAPNVLAANGGKVAIISSRMASSKVANGASYLYRSSKAAAANLGANFAAELKPKGVAVGVYHPGWVKTDMGGAGADITPSASAAGLVDRIERLSLATTGVFEDYAGTAIAH